MATTVSVKVTATDATAPAFESVRRSVAATGKALDAAKTSAGGLARAMASAPVVFNQSLELFRKFQEVARFAFEATTARALQWRSATDAQARAIRAFVGDVQRLQVALGNVLLPILAGVIRAISGTVRAATQWINANRALVGSGIIEFGQALATTVIPAVATGILLAVQAVQGLRMAFSVLAGGAQEAFGAILRSIGSVLTQGAALAERMGLEDTAERLRTLGAQAGTVGDDFRGAFDAGVVEAAALQRQTEALQASIDRAAQAASVGVGKVAAEAYRALGEQIRVVDLAAADAAAAQAERDAASLARKQKIAELEGQVEEGKRDSRIRNLELAAAIEEKIRNASSEAEQRRLAVIGAAVQAYASAIQGTVTNTIGRLFDDIEEGGKNIGAIFGSFFKSLPRLFAETTAAYLVQLGLQKAATALFEAFARQEAVTTAGVVVGAKVAETKAKIAADAAAGGAAAQAGHAGIPFVGLAIGAAAAAAIVAAVMAFSKFAVGGKPAGSGVDNMLVMVNAGERILSGPETRALERGVMPAAGGGARAGGGSAQAVPVVVEQRLVLEALPDRTSVERYRRDVVAPADRRARRRGAM
jgi:hypothetical protein